MTHRPDPRAAMSRRTFVGGSAAAGLGAVTAGWWSARNAAAAPVPAGSEHAEPNGRRSGYVLPRLEFADDRPRRYGTLYDAALTDLVGINTVYADPTSYDKAGLIDYPPGSIVRAGGGYPAPQRWTRDAAINAWSGASAITPEVARNTLVCVLDPADGGGQVVQQDNQWWDQVVWIVAAWHHYLVTGDDDFRTLAYPAARATMAAREKANFDADHGLFRGPSLMNDGIAGYPQPPWQPGIHSSFVLDYPHTDQLLCLSTNCVYAGAYDALAAFASSAGDDAASATYTRKADAVRAAVNKYLWRSAAGTYGYFVHGDDGDAGQLDTHQEGAGLALAVLMGVAHGSRAKRLLDSAHWQPHGIVNVWPAFDRFSDDKPGRHNVMVWPMVNGLFGHAAAVGGRVDLLARTIERMADLVTATDGNFYELYNSITGAVDGGWQTGGDGALNHFDSQPDQAWSATGYLRLVHDGVFGLRYTRRGLTFAPSLPDGWGTVTLRGFAYRDQTVDVTLTGSGNRVRSVRIDGHATTDPVLPAGRGGHHTVAVTLG